MSLLFAPLPGAPDESAYTQTAFQNRTRNAIQSADCVNRKNLVWHRSLIDREQREAANGHRAAVIWFTGLPASGKSTTAHAVESCLFESGCQAYALDGDNIRHGLSADLGFSPADRHEHLRRTGELAKLMHSAGMIELCAFISPTRESRLKVRNLLPDASFFEVYCRCPAEICEQRDPKGFYARARKEGFPRLAWNNEVRLPAKPAAVTAGRTARLSHQAWLAWLRSWLVRRIASDTLAKQILKEVDGLG